jgi:hypothetical protein
MGTKKTNQNLTIDILNQVHDKEFIQIIVTVDIKGKKYDVLVDKTFSIAKIKEIVMEILNKRDELNSVKDIFDIPNYMMFLIIKYMTNLDVAKVDSFAEQINVFNIMADLDVITPIFEHINKTEIEKIDKLIKQVLENTKNINDNPDMINEFYSIFNESKSLTSGN